MATFIHALGAPLPDACRGGALTIGNFDGVHRGHQALLAEAVHKARPAVAVTFDPHPIQILRPELVQPFLSTLDNRTQLLHQYGVDHVLVLKTSPAFLHLSASDFFEQIVADGLRAKFLIEGYSFAFGRNREGTIDVLKQLCAEKGVRLTLIPPQEVAGQRVSSSRIRAELMAGHADVAAQMLGRPYRITGVVGTGARRGATLGFPTANLEQIPTLIPGNGVYAARAVVDGATWPAAVNIGPNPTFGDDARKVETHLVGFSGQIYGKSLCLDFVKKVRDTRPFASVQELITQIRADVDEVTRTV
ncbi:MAG TPA: riboflavin biosynthesis protein RibF [Gemmataceae bacterium]|nr:riboflavin biosynthesis protein RibF [Gemmataceae bacterium]